MQASSGSLVDRMIGAIKLDSATYEEVERDENATTQALIVVAIAAVAAAIGGLGNGAEGFIGGLIAGVLGWIVASALVYVVGTKIITDTTTSTTMGQVLRVMGFARAPAILSIFSFIPLLGWIAALAAFVLGIAATVIAIRAAFDTTTGRAIVIALVSWVIAVIVSAIILAIFGISLAVTG